LKAGDTGGNNGGGSDGFDPLSTWWGVSILMIVCGVALYALQRYLRYVHKMRGRKKAIATVDTRLKHIAGRQCCV
jgi:hypothetical protein